MSNDGIQIVIGGVSYQDWLEVDIDSDVMTPADGWSCTGALPRADVLASFREGAKCDIYVGDDRQMAGVIDDADVSIDRGQSRLRVSGRDLGAFLLEDESAPIKVDKLTVKQLFEKLIRPSWGIKNIVISNEDNVDLLIGKDEAKQLKRTAPKGKPLKSRLSVKIDPGQTVASILDEHTQRVGLTWWITAQGDLFIGKPNYTQEVAYNFRCYAFGSRKAVNNNVESATISRSMQGRHDEITVNGQGIPGRGEAFNRSKKAPRFAGTATDSDLKQRGIERHMIMRDTDALNIDEALTRAQAEMGRRRLSALTIKLVVPDFRDRENARLFAVDTLASVEIEDANISGSYYVTQRRFRENRGVRRTELTLKEKGVWLA